MDNDGESDHKSRCKRGPGDWTHDEDGGGKISRVAGDSRVHGGGSAAETYDYTTGQEYIYDDDDGYAYETEVETSALEQVEQERYRVLSEDGIRARQAADVAKVAEVLSIPPDWAAVLLRHFKWRDGKLQDEWFSEEARVRGATGLPASDGGGVPTAVADREVVCAICYDGYAAGRKLSAGCFSHYYCRSCWRGYVHAAVGEGPGCLSLRCPDPSCSAVVLGALVDEVADQADRDRYARFALRSYVEDSGGGRIKWCPGPGCPRAVEFFLGGGNEASACADVVCECGHAFCFRCGEEAHRPVSCETVRAWLAKNGSDLENANWMLAHTKNCPKCRQPIEKNQGCNHMRCRCGHHFCWLCLDPLPPNGGCRGCAGYRLVERAQAAVGAGPSSAAGKELASKMEEEDRRRREAKVSLDRYLYHYERWAENDRSLKRVRKDMDELRRLGLQKMAAAVDRPATELAFLTKAYELVADGRRVLRWAHAYGYFLHPERDAGAKRALFEHLLDQANACLERLHGYVELERKELFGRRGDAGVMVEMLKPYKEKVTNVTRVTRTFLENLVKAFETDLPEVKSLN